MRRLALALALIAGCGPSGPTSDAAGPDASMSTDASRVHDAGIDAITRDAFVAADAFVSIDVGPIDGYVPGPARDTTRPVAPLSGSIVTQRTPTLRWALASSVTSATISICSDRACAHEITSFDATGTSGAPAMPLPPGIVFWRVVPNDGAPSATWELFIPEGSAPAMSAWDAHADVDGDGYADAVVRWYGGPLAPRVVVLGGTPSGLASEGRFVMQRETWDVGGVADVNGDGFADALIGMPEGLGVVMGSETSLRGAPEIVLEAGYGTTVGDLDGDGYGDIAVLVSSFVDAPTLRLDVFLGGPDGPSPVASQTIALSTPDWRDYGKGIHDIEPIEIAVLGDVTGDGLADLAITRGNGTPVYAYGPSGLAVAFTIPTPDQVPSGIGNHVSALGDVNGDGWMDVAVTVAEPVAGAATMIAQDVYLGSSAGLVLTPVTTPTTRLARTAWSTQTRARPFGDLDGDGRGDALFVVTPPFGGIATSAVHLGTATGLDANVAAMELRTRDALPVGDVNGDARLDFVSVGSSGVILYVGQTHTPWMEQLGTPVTTFTP